MPRNRLQRVAGQIAAVLNGVAGPRTAGTGILVYHRVWASQQGSEHASMNVTPAAFRRQLEGLLDAGYRFTSLNDLLQFSADGVPEKTLVVTFDDIFQCVYEKAWPILEDLKIPAVMFLATAFLDSKEPFPFDSWGKRSCKLVPAESYLPATAAQCIEMQATGRVELGAHTHTHRSFGNDIAGFKQDLQTCLDVLGSEFQLSEIPFAFPYGRRSLGCVSDALIAAAGELGVTCALTTDCSTGLRARGGLESGRFNVYEWDTASTIIGKVNGWYGWAPTIQDRYNHLRNRHAV